MKEITVPASVDHLREVIQLIDEQLEALDCPMKAQMQIDVAVDELFSNIARYAYAPDTGEATVRFDFDAADRSVSVSFEDSGVPFDPLAKGEPDISAPVHERPIGGLGIFLVRKTMDDVRYEYKNGRNVLTISKRI